MHPFEKYDVTIGNEVVVIYYTRGGSGSMSSFVGEIGDSPWDGFLRLYLNDFAFAMIDHNAIASIQKTETLLQNTDD
jgi:hypothetical protein